MVRLCALVLLATLLIVRVSRGQLQDECPSCCHHTFTQENITTGNSQAFWDCNESEEFVIHATRCFSECAYNVSVGMYPIQTKLL